MPLRIEDYALVGDFHTAALVGRNGDIDWLCLPRFDSPACFAALLGTEENGSWRLAPRGEPRTTRRYRPGTLVLETDFETPEGTARVIDFMPPRQKSPRLVRVVEGLRGRVAMRLRLVLRYDYGWIVPWVFKDGDQIVAVAGPNEACLQAPIPMDGSNEAISADFEIAEGQRLAFVLTWHEAHEGQRNGFDALASLDDTMKFWTEWSARGKPQKNYADIVQRSLITLKALIYDPTGGIVAAPTTSLPEELGGMRNWDYRYCWIRDATFSLYALSVGGYGEESRRWRDWLLRVVAGSASQLQIMYGVTGDRRLTELSLDWLPGYEGSKPVRIGNGAWNQRQLDVYGEVMDAIHVAHRAGVSPDENAWSVQRELMDHLEKHWMEPDEGIWEVRGGPQQFTHSKVMAWVAVDRAVKTVQKFGMKGPIERWQRLRQEMHDTICRDGYDAEIGAFTQAFGTKALDASVLMIPLVGFLPARDERMRNTVRAIEAGLTHDGFVYRYHPTQSLSDGLPPGQATFLPCSFWLVDNLALLGEHERARALFERLIGLCNDVGLIAEGYDVKNGRLLGNFPQAFTHVGIINSAYNLSKSGGPAQDREKS